MQIEVRNANGYLIGTERLENGTPGRIAQRCAQIDAAWQGHNITLALGIEGFGIVTLRRGSHLQDSGGRPFTYLDDGEFASGFELELREAIAHKFAAYGTVALA